MKEFQLRAWVHAVTGDVTSVIRFILFRKGFYYAHCASPDSYGLFFTEGLFGLEVY